MNVFDQLKKRHTVFNIGYTSLSLIYTSQGFVFGQRDARVKDIIIGKK